MAEEGHPGSVSVCPIHVKWTTASGLVGSDVATSTSSPQVRWSAWPVGVSPQPTPLLQFSGRVAFQVAGLSRRRALLLFETPSDQGNDTGQTCKANHGIANSEGHENSWRAGWLKCRHEPEQTKGCDGQQGQCSDDGGDDSHGHESVNGQ